MFDFTSKLAHFPDKAEFCVHSGIHRSLSTVFIDLVAGICNHNCIFCDGKYLPLENKMFSSDRLMEMADELVLLGVDSVIIVGEGGESTLHPAFCDFADRLCEAGVHLGLYTNGETLKGKTAETAAKFDFVRVSLDAGTKETHNAVHLSKNPDAFDLIVSQLDSFSKQKRGDLGVSYVVLPENIDDIPLAARICEEQGVDFLELKPFYSPNYTFDIEMYRSLAGKLEKYYKQTSETCRRLHVVLNNQFKEWLKYGFAPRDLTRLVEERLCVTSKLRMVISPNGCFLCTCFRNVDAYNMGDPNLLKLDEIWYGDKHLDLIGKPCCLKCTYHEQNEFLLRLQKGEVSLPEPDGAVRQIYFL